MWTDVLGFALARRVRAGAATEDAREELERELLRERQLVEARRAGESA